MIIGVIDIIGEILWVIVYSYCVWKWLGITLLDYSVKCKIT